MVILQKTNLPVDVVLNGFEFAQWARSVRPELKILLAGTPERLPWTGMDAANARCRGYVVGRLRAACGPELSDPSQPVQRG
jgi:hypothetical protein